MRVLRWMIVTIGLLGGALGLAATVGAASLTSAAVTGSGVGDGLVTQEQWGYRRH